MATPAHGPAQGGPKMLDGSRQYVPATIDDLLADMDFGAGDDPIVAGRRVLVAKLNLGGAGKHRILESLNSVRDEGDEWALSTIEKDLTHVKRGWRQYVNGKHGDELMAKINAHLWDAMETLARERNSLTNEPRDRIAASLGTGKLVQVFLRMLGYPTDHVVSERESTVTVVQAELPRQVIEVVDG